MLRSTGLVSRESYIDAGWLAWAPAVNSVHEISEGNSPRHPARGKFLGSALVIAVIMFLGFSRNYYLRHWLGTRELSLAAYLHGLIMTTWVLPFLTQTFLISRHRLALHRILGTAGAGLARGYSAPIAWG